MKEERRFNYRVRDALPSLADLIVKHRIGELEAITGYTFRNRDYITQVILWGADRDTHISGVKYQIFPRKAATAAHKLFIEAGQACVDEALPAGKKVSGPHSYQLLTSSDGVDQTIMDNNLTRFVVTERPTDARPNKRDKDFFFLLLDAIRYDNPAQAATTLKNAIKKLAGEERLKLIVEQDGSVSLNEKIVLAFCAAEGWQVTTNIAKDGDPQPYTSSATIMDPKDGHEEVYEVVTPDLTWAREKVFAHIHGKFERGFSKDPSDKLKLKAAINQAMGRAPGRVGER